MLILLEKIIASIQNDFYDKHWIWFILKLLISLVGLICMGLLLEKITVLIIYNIESIVVTIGAIFIFFMILAQFIPKRREEKPILQSECTVIEFDPITLETTYSLIRKNLCSILGDVAEIIKIRKPSTLSQMDSPTHYTIVSNAVIYHYLAVKTTDEVDIFNAIGILQNALEQRLNNNEVEGIIQTHFLYKSQAYPSLMVDNVKDTGAYVQIDIAVASDNYCKYRERRIYNNMNRSGVIRPQDKDF